MNELQRELFEWFINNFTKDKDNNNIPIPKLINQQVVGMIEEIGELAHSILKQEQGIRKNENHLEMISDAIGDIIIYSSNLCSLLAIKLDDVIKNVSSKGKSIVEPMFAILYLNLEMSNFIESFYDLDEDINGDNETIQFSFDEDIINYTKDEKFTIIFSITSIYQTLQAISNFYGLQTIDEIIKSTANIVLNRDWNKHRSDNEEII